MNAKAPPNGTMHVDEVTGLLYVEGQLEAPEARGVVAHLEACGECRRLLDALKRESLLLRQALEEEDEPVPAALLAARIREGLSWWWLSVFSLTAAGVYMMWTYYLEPWLENFQQSGFGGQFFFTWLLLNGASWKGWDEMLQWAIFGSLGVLAFVLLFLFRRNLRRITSLSIFLAALLLLMLALPPAARGAEFVRHVHSYELPQDKTVSTDLFVFAASARISGTVEGDLYCFCSTLSVDGHVTGDVIAFSSVAHITGKVDGNIRSFSGSLQIEGEVGRNLTSFVGMLQTAAHSHIHGSATLFTGQAQFDGELGRDLQAYMGEGTLNGPIGGDVFIRQASGQRREAWGHEEHGPIQVTSHADIKGSFQVRGPLEPEVSHDAHLASPLKYERVEDLPAYRNPMSYWYNAMIWGAGFLVGIVFIALAPGFMNEATREVARIGAPLGVGFAAFVLMPIAAALACFTVVGLGLGIPVLFVWLFLVFFGQVFTAIWVGELILGAGSGAGAWSLTGRLALGLLLIRLGALIPVAGTWVRFVAALLGLGALTLIVFHRMQRRGPHLPAAPAPATPAAA